MGYEHWKFQAVNGILYYLELDHCFCPELHIYLVCRYLVVKSAVTGIALSMEVQLYVKGVPWWGAQILNLKKKRQCLLLLFLIFSCRIKESPMSPVDFKKLQCSLLLIFKCSCSFENSPMSPVKLKKRLCCPFKFKDRQQSIRPVLVRLQYIEG